MVENNTLPTYCLQSTAWRCRSLFAREAKPAGLVTRSRYLLPSSAMLLWKIITASPGVRYWSSGSFLRWRSCA